MRNEKLEIMELNDVFRIAAETGDFPIVEISEPLKHFPNTKGRIVQIRPDGVAVDFGGKWDKWFHAQSGNDKRSNYMSELKPCNVIESI